MPVRNYERAMTLPTEELESAIRLVQDYPAAVWIFQADHLQAIADYAEETGALRVSALCSGEIAYRASGPSPRQFSVFGQPADVLRESARPPGHPCQVGASNVQGSSRTGPGASLIPGAA
jgi:hypothetical protein